MNRPDFTELVMALKGGSSKGVGFQPAKPRNFLQDPKSKGCRCLACGNGRLHSCHQGWATFGCGTCSILPKRLCFHTVEDSEARGREDPWLNMGILQGLHRIGIHSKEFWLHLKMQTSWPCECNKWQLAPICEGIFRIHVWNPTYAWIKPCVPLCDGAFNLGQVQAWGELACLIIKSHHESGRLFRCGMGQKIWVEKGEQISSQEGMPWRGMELRARHLKRGKTYTIKRLGF